MCGQVKIAFDVFLELTGPVYKLAVLVRAIVLDLDEATALTILVLTVEQLCEHGKQQTARTALSRLEQVDYAPKMLLQNIRYKLVAKVIEH